MFGTSGSNFKTIAVFNLTSGFVIAKQTNEKKTGFQTSFVAKI